MSVTRRRATTAAGLLVVAVLLGSCAEDSGGEPVTGGTGGGATAEPAGDDARGTGTAAASPTAPAATSPSPASSVGAPPDAYTFTPAPHRVPRTPARARELTRRASLAPEDWTPGMVPHIPYESSGTVPVLPDSCVWTREPAPATVLDAYTRRIDLPATGGKGRVSGTLTVTVHRDAAHADREMRSTVQESFRCPTQHLGGGERLEGLQSMRLDPKDVKNADATLFEAGAHRASGDARPQPYVWTKSRIGPVVTAVSVKGAQGYTDSDLIRFAAEAGAKLLYRVELELS
ncbi:hypothetical protein C6N75_22590 [Streptomyces solincola]|uniref:Lipoprotein n=1 Tax=Streptomyces solincola TaxID=2100817 RepID=A0A2S9PRF2_9ACTN|nr:hypothetical protein C6N75_22590 [Streptomyces solincola]